MSIRVRIEVREHAAKEIAKTEISSAFYCHCLFHSNFYRNGAANITY